MDWSKKEKILSLLGLAQRAGKLITGEEQVVFAIQNKEAKLVFLSQDTGKHTTKKIATKTTIHKVALSTDMTSLELSQAIGKSRKVVAVIDEGFAQKMRSMME